jgi:glycosyltransferase involved in cell wall biosynthesis
MKIAIFTETFVPKVDGIVTTLCQTIRQLERKGHEVLIVAPDGGEVLFQQSKILGMPGRAFFFYPELTLALPHRSIRTELAKFQPDVIHVADPALLGIAALYYAGGRNGGALGLPLVVSYHTDLPRYLHHYGLGFLEPMIWPLLRARHHRATINLCTSQVVLSQLKDHGIARTAFWPGGVDADLHTPARRSDAMRLRLSGGRSGPLLLYAGRLSAEKGIERLKPILDGLPGATLALVGDGPHRATLEAIFKGLPVVFLGFLHGEELASAFASSDVFVMPSVTETLGLVVLEAMSAGLPVVGARAGGIPDLIEHGVNGYLFDDEAGAIQAVNELLTHPVATSAMRRNARETALKHSWDAATEILLGHYREARVRIQGEVAPEILPAERSKGTLRTLGDATTGLIKRLLS